MGVCGSKGSLTSQHMDTAMKKESGRRRLITEHRCAAGHMQTDWPSGEGSNKQLQHTHRQGYALTHLRRKGPAANTYGCGYRFKKSLPHAHSHIYTH